MKYLFLLACFFFTSSLYAQDISDDALSQQETSVAISRPHANLIVVGSNDATCTVSAMGGHPIGMPAYYSRDTGHSWSLARLPLDSGTFAIGDPSLTADDNGTIYYAYMTGDDSSARAGGKNFVANLAVAYTTDGEHWTKCAPVYNNKQHGPTIEDKEWIAVDQAPKSWHFGRIYVVWHEINVTDPTWNIAMIAWSDDTGKTWSEAWPYDVTGVDDSPQIRVGPDGTVYIASGDESVFGDLYKLQVSKDYGASFTPNYIVTGSFGPVGDSGYFFTLKGVNGPRVLPYESFDFDGEGNIQMVYMSYDSNAAYLYHIHSSNNGDSWSDPVAIGTPGLLHTDHFFPWVNYDSAAGKTNVIFFSSEEDAQHNAKIKCDRVDLAYPSTVIPIGHSLFDPVMDTTTLAVSADTGLRTMPGTAFLGDYIGLDSYNGVNVAAWPETSPTHPADADIFAAVWSSSDKTSRVIKLPTEQNMVGEIVPNPCGEEASITLNSAMTGAAMIELTTLNGSLVRTISEPVAATLSFSTASLANGDYLCRITCDGLTIVRKLVVQH